MSATAPCCPTTAGGSRAYCAGPYERALVPGAGHFLPEEAPDVVNDHLVALARRPPWLAGP